MTDYDPKATLHRYLQSSRETVVWKLEGLSEYDVRRPMTSTGTNLLGLVKHLAAVEIGYFGETFGRPSELPMPWAEEDAEDNADMWATAEESREHILGLYRQAWKHADATIEELGLDSLGRVPWWPSERAEVTLHQILVHVVTETARHAGHADIVRELIDGSVGLRVQHSNLPPGDAEWWAAYRERLETTARQVAERAVR